MEEKNRFNNQQIQFYAEENKNLTKKNAELLRDSD